MLSSLEEATDDGQRLCFGDAGLIASDAMPSEAVNASVEFLARGDLPVEALTPLPRSEKLTPNSSRRDFACKWKKCRSSGNRRSRTLKDWPESVRMWHAVCARTVARLA
mmetsp:Transcript_122829/g.213134  ORF Transcript_122829/g.213134 Transcript_122829/m.213134 type:complete len:109 (+) Transcript_122829:530-856(+)